MGLRSSRGVWKVCWGGRVMEGGGPGPCTCLDTVGRGAGKDHWELSLMKVKVLAP